MSTILENVLAAMQEADELGGPDYMDYVKLMQNIAAVANDRARTAFYNYLKAKYQDLEFEVGESAHGGIDGVIYLFANDMAIHDPTDNDYLHPGEAPYYGLTKEDAIALYKFNAYLVQRYLSEEA